MEALRPERSKFVGADDGGMTPLAVFGARKECAGSPRRLACEMPEVTTGPTMEDDMIDIARLRRHLDMTQEEFAAVLGVTVGTVNRWENGHFKPSRLAEKALKNLLSQVKKSGLDGGRG